MTQTPKITAPAATKAVTPSPVEQLTTGELDRAVGAVETLLNMRSLGIIEPVVNTRLHGLLVDLHQQRAVRAKIHQKAS